jgi:hypothetical protein
MMRTLSFCFQGRRFDGVPVEEVEEFIEKLQRGVNEIKRRDATDPETMLTNGALTKDDFENILGAKYIKHTHRQLATNVTRLWEPLTKVCAANGFSQLWCKSKRCSKKLEDCACGWPDRRVRWFLVKDVPIDKLAEIRALLAGRNDYSPEVADNLAIVFAHLGIAWT